MGGTWAKHGDTTTTVRHGSCRLRLKIRYDWAEIGLGQRDAFAGKRDALDQKNFARGFTNRAAANRLGSAWCSEGGGSLVDA